MERVSFGVGGLMFGHIYGIMVGLNCFNHRGTGMEQTGFALFMGSIDGINCLKLTISPMQQSVCNLSLPPWAP